MESVNLNFDDGALRYAQKLGKSSFAELSVKEGTVYIDAVTDAIKNKSTSINTEKVNALAAKYQDSVKAAQITATTLAKEANATTGGNKIVNSIINGKVSTNIQSYWDELEMAVRPANKSTSEVVTASNNAKVGGFLNMTKNNTMIAAMQKTEKAGKVFGALAIAVLLVQVTTASSDLQAASMSDPKIRKDEMAKAEANLAIVVTEGMANLTLMGLASFFISDESISKGEDTFKTAYKDVIHPFLEKIENSAVLKKMDEIIDKIQIK